MDIGDVVFFEDFSPVGDIVTICFCLAVFILLLISYLKRSRSLVYFCGCVGLLLIAAFSDITFHYLQALSEDSAFLVVTFRTIYHAALYGILVLYVMYAIEIIHINYLGVEKIIKVAAIILMLLLVAFDILGAYFKFSFYVDEDGFAYMGLNIFPIGYLIYVITLMLSLYIFRKNIYRQILFGVFGTVMMSFILLIVQQFHDHASYTVASFIFPTLSLMYLIHSSPFDVSLGAVNIDGFESYVKYHYKKNKGFVLLSMYLHEFDMADKKYPDDMQEVIRDFASHYFKGAVLFMLSNGHMVLCVDKNKNPDYENKTNAILNQFNEEYPKYRFDYKIAIVNSVDEISENNNYIDFIKFINNNMKQNTVTFSDDSYVEKFRKHKYILEEVLDIAKKGDLDDERVLVYCQPVYNIKTGKYDTAEDLMRLRLPEIGIVFPDQFIEIAEKEKVIHDLTLIILHKTSAAIRKFLVEGYIVNRISVNISVAELSDPEFCNDVYKIISDCNIPFDKVALEITESQNESDFNTILSIIGELKDKGVLFYLDDFGTGYSNMERIMELPFDIIKFDRSLVLASTNNPKSKMMVSHMAHMFNDMHYSVLYEGVESEEDENNLKKMSAQYLQGYRYSKPIPIDKLVLFFDKQEIA